MRVWATWFLGIAAAIALAAVLSAHGVIGGAAVAVLYGAIVLAAGVGTGQIARRRRDASRASAEQSVEHDLATQAGSRAFYVAVVVILLLGVLATVQAELAFAAWCYGAAVVAVAGYGIIYAALRRRTL